MRVILVFFASVMFATAQRTVEEKIRLLEPFLMLTDELFEKVNDNQCLDKLFCLLETEIAEDIDNPLKHVSRFLTNSQHDTDPTEFHQIEALIERYPNVSRILDSVRLGQSSRMSSVCSTTFSQCEAEASAIMKAARKFDDTSVAALSNHLQHVQRRKVCTYIKACCTGLKVGCGICAIFTFGTCGFACGPFASAACTASKLTCTAISIIG